MNPPAESILASVCCDQQKWSRAANRLKKGLELARAGLLWCVILAPALAVVGTLCDQSVFNMLAAALLATAGSLRTLFLKRDRTEAWIRCRSVSEGIKTELYTYLVRAGKYRIDAGREVVLSSEVGSITGKVEDLLKHVRDSDCDDLSEPSPLDVDGYISNRVTDQIDRYYRPTAERLLTQMGRFQTAEVVLSFGAAILTAVAAIGGPNQLGLLTGVLAAAIAAIAAHIEGARFQRQAISYRVVANRLTLLRNQWTATHASRSPTADEVDELVANCEGAISIENQGWMASWDDSGPVAKSAGS